MVERNSGHIVTIASLVGATPVPGMSDYVASKHAAYGFAESLRTELAMTPRREDDRGHAASHQHRDVRGAKSPWYFPELTPDYAATRILNAVERNRQRLLLNRPAVLTAYSDQVVPTGRVRPDLALGGAFDGMKTFHGRSVIDQSGMNRRSDHR